MEDKDKKFVNLFLQMLDCYEFSLHFVGDRFFVKDLQHGNLGNIESETFETLKDICQRMEVYHIDYLDRAIEEDTELSLWDLASLYLTEHSEHLQDCSVNAFKNYLTNNGLDVSDYEEKINIDDNELQ